MVDPWWLSFNVLIPKRDILIKEGCKERENKFSMFNFLTVRSSRVTLGVDFSIKQWRILSVIVLIVYYGTPTIPFVQATIWNLLISTSVLMCVHVYINSFFHQYIHVCNTHDAYLQFSSVQTVWGLSHSLSNNETWFVSYIMHSLNLEW